MIHIFRNILYFKEVQDPYLQKNHHHFFYYYFFLSAFRKRLNYILRKPKGSSILSVTGLFSISSGMKTRCDITKAVPCGYFTSLMTQLMEHAALSKCMSGKNYMTEQEVLCGRGNARAIMQKALCPSCHTGEGRSHLNKC